MSDRIDLTAAKARATELWEGFTSGQRTVLGITVLAVLVAGGMLLRAGSGTEHAVLYSDLSPTDASEITTELESTGSSYQLADGGRTILVPRADVYQLRIDLSGKGMPSGDSKGYALLDEQGITTSEFRQRVDYQRALEGELSKTIGAIDGVEAATVHLVIQQDDLFKDDHKRSTASVLVRTTEQGLGPRQVQAVVHLVASSVEGLAPEDVTVADGAGNVLNAPGVAGQNAAAADLHSANTAAFEQAMASKIQQQLSPVVGTGGAMVSVAAVLDHDERNTVTEQFVAPEEGDLVVEETTTSETYNGAVTGVGGALGPDGVPVGGADETEYTKEAAHRVHAFGKTVQEIREAPGAVQRLSVAVLVDEARTGNVDMLEVERLVAAAAGLDEERGDTLAITQIAFDRTGDQAATEAAEAAAAAERQEQSMRLMRAAAALVVLALILFLAWRNAKKAAIRREPLDVAGMLPPAPDDRELVSVGAPTEALAAGSDDDDASLPVVAPESTPLNPLQEQVAAMIDRQPEEVAAVLRGWLADRRS